MFNQRGTQKESVRLNQNPPANILSTRALRKSCRCAQCTAAGKDRPFGEIHGLANGESLTLHRSVLNLIFEITHMSQVRLDPLQAATFFSPIVFLASNSKQTCTHSLSFKGTDGWMEEETAATTQQRHTRATTIWARHLYSSARVACVCAALFRRTEEEESARCPLLSLSLRSLVRGKPGKELYE